jgi:hypothetical protein
MIFIIKPLKMSKKIRITEDQYNRLLLSINELDEAKKYDTTIKEPNLLKVKNTILSVKPNTELIFDLVDGTIITLCFIADKNDTYIFKVKNIKGNKKFDYLNDNIIIINKNITTDNLRNVTDGVYEIIFKYYRNNKKLFKIEKLKFNFVKIGGPCSVGDENKKKKEKKKPILSGDTENNIQDDEDIDIINAKEAYNLILGDKKLQQAFYKAPSLWNLFLAELKDKKATGSGILPTLQLVGSYQNKKITEALGARFIPGKKVVFYFDNYKNNYINATVVEDKKPHLGRVFLEYIKDDKKYLIRIISKIKNTNSSFNASLSISDKEEQRLVKITIIENQSKEGYISNL